MILTDTFRLNSRGHYDTDFSFLQSGSGFPSAEVRGRNMVYRWRHKQYTGEYGRNKNLICHINSVETTIPYKVLTLNYFKLLSSKMTDLVMNNEIQVKTGDIERDKKIADLIEDTNWRDGVRSAFKMSTEYGDVCIKTYKGGISAFSPLHCFKVVDRSDKSKILGYVLYEPIYKKIGHESKINYIRFEIHFKGKVYECVKDFIGHVYGGTLGSSVAIKYKGRTIPKEGLWYNTGINDCELVQFGSISKEDDGVYGTSIYEEIQDVVFAIEQRVSVNMHLLDNSLVPFIVVGTDMVETVVTENGNEERRLKLIDGKYMISTGEGQGVKSVELNYNLGNSENLIQCLQGFLYELSEMGKTFLSGEYSGNISEETLNNTIKSAIDKGNRLLTELYSVFRDSLYCLCRLNGIDVRKSDINIQFNVGRTDDDLKVSQICETLSNNKILSRRSIRERYFGMNSEQSDAEEICIHSENSEPNLSNETNDNDFVDTDKELGDTENNKNIMEVSENDN